MTNEMSLLIALCEALGFEVEAELDYQERRLANRDDVRWDESRTLKCKGPHGMLDVDSDGMYTSMLKTPVITYTLIKGGRKNPIDIYLACGNNRAVINEGE